MRWMLLFVIAACGPSGSMPTPDAAPVVDGPVGCPALPDAAHFNFFGEACTAAPYPANTICHDGDRGWCIDGTCRPMAYLDGCPICPAGSQRFAPAGAAYCAPPM